MREQPEDPLCAGVLRHLRALVLASGGATEEEAAVLLRVLERLAEIQRDEGEAAAEAAALAVRRAWLSEEAPSARRLG